MFRNRNTKKYKERIMKPTDNGKGYKIIGLRKPQKKKKNFYIHRLVAETFILNPNNYNYINHKDFNRSNNSIENLEWCTQSYNIKYSLHRNHHPHSKQVAKISPHNNVVIETYKSIGEASRRNNISTTHISYCCKGKVQTAKRIYMEIHKITSNKNLPQFGVGLFFYLFISSLIERPYIIRRRIGSSNFSLIISSSLLVGIVLSFSIK